MVTVDFTNINTECTFGIDNIAGLLPDHDEWEALVQRFFDVLLGADPHNLFDALTVEFVDPNDQTHDLLLVAMTMTSFEPL
jgi:hypothetical protein